MSQPSRDPTSKGKGSQSMDIYPPTNPTQRSAPTRAQITAAKAAEAARLAAAASAAAASELATTMNNQRAAASRRRPAEPAGQWTATTLSPSRQTQPMSIPGPSGTQQPSAGSNAPWTLAGGGTKDSWLRRGEEQLAKSGDDSKRHW